ncbi:hypothetical protein WG622_16040 [Cognatishimia sp. D5M38]|uniref:RNA polymerase sigma-54 factor n=1 Tax=Cognatishimia coralii TaxID=3083254 RepID=A0ABU8QK17_9RHOB|nr:hypothetical protein [Sulfitobacter sp. PR48]MDD9722824.1 hypothetical protein [Sulfitobacter sp. PR48]
MPEIAPLRLTDRPGLSLQTGQRAAAKTAPGVLSFVQTCALSEDEHVEAVVVSAGHNPALAVSFDIADPPRHRPPPAFLSKSSRTVLNIAVPQTSLYTHVAAQIPLLVKDRALHPIAHKWLEVLEPSGWVGANVTEIAAFAGTDAPVAETVLLALQDAEPSGLFARSLAECLSLQLAAQDALTDQMRALLSRLPLLAAGSLAELARECAVPLDTLAAMIRRLRGLNPKPGADFEAGPIAPPGPDMFLFKDEAGQWQLERNSYLKPTLSLATCTDKSLISGALRELRTFEARDTMIFLVAKSALDVQAGFLNGDIAYPQVLTASALAHDLSLHETTVGRIRKHLTLGIEGGRFAFSDLFFRGIGTGNQGPVTSLELQHRIAEICRTHPERLSDREIAEELAIHGLLVARRTVCKHRPRTALRRAGADIS